MKAYLKKLSKLLSISLSLAIILTVLPIHTVRVYAAETVTVAASCQQYGGTHQRGRCSLNANDASKYGLSVSGEFDPGSSGGVPASSYVSFSLNSNSEYKIVKATLGGKDYYSSNGTFVKTGKYSSARNSYFSAYVTLEKKHTHSYDAWSSDGTNHWHQCVGSDCTDLNGSKKDTAKHTFTWEYNDAGTQHRQKCTVCGYTTAWANHSGGAATCTAQAKCATCGQFYGTALGHNYRETWTYDETNHWYQCERCLDKKDEAEHTGGTATCIQLAVCKTCGKEYGDFGSHNLEHKNAQAANCIQDGWQEYWECSTPDCGAVFANAEGTGTKYTEISWKDGAGKIEKNNDHLWSYAVNGNTITATCSRNTTEHTASISITASDAEYTGSAYIGTDESAWTNSSLGLTVPTVNYIGRDGTTYESTTAPTNAGKYTAQITAGTVTASDDFEITKKEVELNWHNTVVTYNGTAQTPTATVINKANTTDEVNVNVTFAGGHTNAGTYTATASSLSGADASNYKLPTILPTEEFKIEPKAIGTTTITASYTKTNPQIYTGNEFTQTISIVDGSNQLTSNSDYQLEGDIAKTMPGLYDTKVKGIGNYTGETTVEWEIVAAEIDNDDIHVTPYNAEYDGAYHSITVAPKEELAGATVTYSTTKDGTYSATNPSYKNAGEYTVYYKVEKTGHTTLKDFSTVTISHKEVTIGWSNTELIYNGSAQAPTATVTNKVNGDVVNVTVSGAETKAGTYTAVASGLYGDNSENYVLNYKLPIVEPSTTFTIKKAKVDAPTADSTTFTYNGQQKTYTLATSDLYTISNNTRTLAGTHTVSVALVDKDNYEWNGVTGTDDQKVADREYAFTINKATVTIPTADSTTYTYTGQAQTYGLTETNDYTVSNSTHTNAGSYEVDVILTDHNNYMWSDGTIDNQKYDFVIHKAEVTAPNPLTTTFIYNTNAQTYNLPTNNNVYTISNNTHTNAGTYKVDVVLKDNKNYKWSDTELDYKEYTFTINKKAVTIPTQDSTVFTYNGSEKVYSPIVVSTETNLYDILNNKHYNAGTYTVSVVLKNKENYEWNDAQATTPEQKIANRTYTFTINKAKVDIPAENTNTFTYNGNEQTYGLTLKPVYSILNNKRTNAGSQTVTVSLNDKNNYEWKDIQGTDKTVDQTYTFTINKAKVNKPLANTNTFTYNREEQTYTLATSDLYTISNNEQVNAGTYTVTVSLNDKGNYDWSHITSGDKTVDQTYTFTINPLDISNSATIALDHAYYEFTGLEKVAHVSKVTDGTVEIFEDIDFDLTNNKAINPGSYTLTATFKGNYKGSINKEWLIVEDVQHTQDVKLSDDEGYVGKLELVVTGDDEVPNIKIDNPIDLLDESDKTLLKQVDSNNYYLIELIVSLNAYDEELVHEESLEAIEDLMGDQTGSHYYDISIRKVVKHMVNNAVVHTDIYPVTNTEPDEIKITLGMPEEIPSLKAGYSRKYLMIRSHNYGTDTNPDYKAEILDVEVKGDEVSFTSDKFSDYVLAYKDTRIPRHFNNNSGNDESDVTSTYIAPNTAVR